MAAAAVDRIFPYRLDRRFLYLSKVKLVVAAAAVRLPFKIFVMPSSDSVIEAKSVRKSLFFKTAIQMMGREEEDSLLEVKN